MLYSLFPLEHLLTFNGLRGVISQKVLLLITTAVRTADATNIVHVFRHDL